MATLYLLAPCRLRLPEIPAAVGTACGRKYGPPALASSGYNQFLAMTLD